MKTHTAIDPSAIGGLFSKVSADKNECELPPREPERKIVPAIRKKRRLSLNRCPILRQQWDGDEHLHQPRIVIMVHVTAIYRAVELWTV